MDNIPQKMRPLLLLRHLLLLPHLLREVVEV
jgi:hypothetical protein